MSTTPLPGSGSGSGPVPPPPNMPPGAQAGVGGLGGPPGSGLPPPSRRRPYPQDLQDSERAAIILAIIGLGFTLVVPVILLVTQQFHRVERADERAVSLGLTVLFASIAWMFLLRLAGSLDRGESLGIESHWGGLGGGVGGFRISRPVVYLFCAITFGALAAAAVSRYPTPVVEEMPVEKEEGDTGGTGPDAKAPPAPDNKPSPAPAAPPAATPPAPANQTAPAPASP
jgi:hypothetical protein